jgi:spore coat polysaccharide biosynthesis protein SpsF (cytidylyltransferase family)
MKVIAVIQSRMGSTRLRGKSLSPVAGKPLLYHVHKTVSNMPFVDEVIVATSSKTEDDPIQAYTNTFLKSSCYRGDSSNVFSRFKEIALKYDDQTTFMRITGDNMFYQTDVTGSLLQLHLKNKNDYTGIMGLSHITGEFIKGKAFVETTDDLLSDYELEHVTPFFIKNIAKFKTLLVPSSNYDLNPELDSLLTIDSEMDRNRIENLLTYFEQKGLEKTKENIYNYLTRTK